MTELTGLFQSELTDWCKEKNIPYIYPDALDWLLE